MPRLAAGSKAAAGTIGSISAKGWTRARRVSRERASCANIQAA
jgi:hypothetical protein